MVVMKRTRQPVMRPDPRGTRDDRPDLGPEHHSAAMRMWKGASALTRWVLLVAIVGIGAAATVAILLAALFTVVDTSL